MSDIFKDMQANVGCDYISNLPSYKRKVWHEMKRLPLTNYDIKQFDDKQVFDEYIRVIEEEYTIVNTIEYNIYKEPNHQVQNFFQSEYYDFDPVLKLSDYNRLLELRKMPLLSLNDNEYYIVTNSKFAYKVEDNKDIETITVANKNLKLKGYDTKSYWNSITNTAVCVHFMMNTAMFISL